MPHAIRPATLAAHAAVLLLAACSAGRAPSPAGPAPVPVVGPEELLESPTLLGEVVAEAPRDLLGDVDYDLPVVANTWVAAELDFLVGERREVIGRWIRSGDHYEAFVKQVLRSYGVPTDLFHLAMIESGFRPTVRSHAGAVGMWQFMAGTGRSEGLRVDSLVDERMDPVRATHAAARHLRGLYREFGDWALAAAAYNAGSGRITRGLRGLGVDNFWDLAQRGDLAQETRHYVPRLYAVTVIARDRERFGFPPPAADGGFRYDSVTVEYATPLAVISELGGVPEDELRRLNPHLLRGVTPEGGYWVWVPAGTGTGVQRAYLASDFRREQGHGVYVVRRGDNLSTLAELSGVKAARIRELNPDVDFDRLQIGAKLELPYRAAAALTGRAGAKEAGKLAAKGAPTQPASVQPPASHVVAAGESLWGIAREYGVTVAALQAANDLDGSVIRPGQELRIPGGAREAEAAPLAEHVVRSGESLWSIARRYGCTVAALQDANSLGERSTIRPGQKLVIPTVLE